MRIAQGIRANAERAPIQPVQIVIDIGLSIEQFILVHQMRPVMKFVREKGATDSAR